MKDKEALQRIAAYPFSRAEELTAEQMREIAREALAQPEQEPVAWATQMGEYAHIKWGAKRPEYPMVYEVPLYTTPPQRTWVGLTDEEIAELHHEIKVRLMGTYKTEDIYRAIEAKLKEKNDA